MADALTYRSNGSKRPMRRLGEWFAVARSCKIHLDLHRLFEQHYYRIISELFSSGSVLQNKVR